jgi:uncharacterized damage-inducible protein DinB
MKLTAFLACTFVLAATFLSAQAPAAGQKIGIALQMQRQYATIKQNLTEAADKFADADYAYRPSPDIRPYGGQFGHVANYHYNICSAFKGEPNPNQGNDLEKKTTKAEFVKALADSFAYCDSAFSALTDQNAMEFVKQGQNEVTRAGLLVNILTHDNEEYGVITVYIRTKSMVPPSTERSMRGRGMGGRGQ